MSIKSKPHANSTLDNLAEAQKEKIEEWLLGNMGYAQAAALAKKEFGIETSQSAMGRFWQSFVAPRRLVRRQRSAQLASKMVEEISLKPGQWDEPLKDALKETAFNLLQQPNPSTEEVMFIMSCVAKAKDQDLKQEALEHSKEKFKAALRTKLETAMEALKAEIEGNPDALAAFNHMLAALAPKNK